MGASDERTRDDTALGLSSKSIGEQVKEIEKEIEQKTRSVMTAKNLGGAKGMALARQNTKQAGVDACLSPFSFKSSRRLVMINPPRLHFRQPLAASLDAHHVRTTAPRPLT